MNILVVDDHPIFIDGLRHFLTKLMVDLRVNEAANVDQAIEIFGDQKFDLVLIDYKLSEMSGLDLLTALQARDALTPLAIISGEDDPKVAKNAIDLGACGFIPKSLSPQELRGALQMILRGGEFLTEQMRAQVDRLNREEFSDYAKNKRDKSQGLTERQLDVLKLMAKGYTNKQISRVLNISTETVKEHVRNIFVTLRVDNRTMCIARARELGLNVLD